MTSSRSPALSTIAGEAAEHVERAEVSEPADRAAPERPRGPRLQPEVTWLYFVCWMALVGFYWADLLGGSPTAWLSEAGRAAVRITNRDLEVANALQSVSGLEAVLMRRSEASYDEALDYAIDVQRDALRHLRELETAWEIESGDGVDYDAPGADMAASQLAVLLALRGDLEEGLATARAVEGAPGLEALLAAAYAGGPPPEDPTLTYLQSGLRGYTRERVIAALARAAGDDARADTTVAALESEGRARMRGSLALYAANLGLVSSGLVVLGLATVRRRLFGGSTASPLPWSAADGIGVLVRGDMWNRIYFVLLAEVAKRMGQGGLVDQWLTPPLELLLFHAGTAIASLPMIWLTWRHLLAPHAVSFRIFGGSARGIVPIALAATALDLVGTHGLSWIAWRIGFHGHWAEGFDESLAWGASGVALLTSVDYTLWTPLIEELAFRGLLYTSLRRHFGIVTSVLASATIFSLLHFYSLPGFLMTFWSGLVWSLVYERTRSLWPGIAAHAVYNALFVAGLLVVYR